MESLPFDRVDDMLYLGGIDAVSSKDLLILHDISAIVEVLPKPSLQTRWEGISYYSIPIADSPSVKILKLIPEALVFIHKAQEESKNVLVHCMGGISRSASIVCAYQMVKYNQSYEEALERLREFRPAVQPNPGFEEQLRRLPVEDLRFKLKLV